MGNVMVRSPPSAARTRRGDGQHVATSAEVELAPARRDLVHAAAVRLRMVATPASERTRRQLSSQLSTRRVRALLLSGAAGPFAASLGVSALLLLGKELREWAQAHPGAFDRRTLRAVALLSIMAAIFTYLKLTSTVKPRTQRLETTAVQKDD